MGEEVPLEIDQLRADFSEWSILRVPWGWEAVRMPMPYEVVHAPTGVALRALLEQRRRERRD